MSQRELLPTKINLIRLKRARKSIDKIKRILNEKRDIILLYLRQAAQDYEAQRRRAEKYLEGAYGKILDAMVRMGLKEVEKIAELTPKTTLIEFGKQNVFGVIVPQITLIEDSVPTASYGFVTSSSALDEAVDKMKTALNEVLRLVEMEAKITLLVNELKKTQRLINALDNVIIPRYDRQIKFIEMVLEENMREEFVRLKMLKKVLEKRRISRY